MSIFLALLAPILWGNTYVTVGLFLQEQSPVCVVVWRALPAGVLLLLIHPAKPPLPVKRILLLSFCNIAACFLLLFIAAYRLLGSVAGTLGATMLLQVMLLRWLQEGKRPSQWIALLSLAGIAGVGLVLNLSSVPGSCCGRRGVCGNAVDCPIDVVDKQLVVSGRVGADRLAIATLGSYAAAGSAGGTAVPTVAARLAGTSVAGAGQQARWRIDARSRR